MVHTPRCSSAAAGGRRAAGHPRPLALLILTACAAAPGACKTGKELEEVKAQLAESRASELALRGEVEKLRQPPPPPPPPPPRGPDPMKIYSVPAAGAPARGAADAWVTIVMFADFQCKFCGDGAAVVAEVERAYGKDVRVVFRHNPLGFHPRALPAAQAAVCAAAQKRFWPVYEALFANTRAQAATDPRGLGRGAGMDDADFERALTSAGGRTEPFRACLKDPTTKARIDDDQALALRLGARGTPAFFVNGRFLGGAQPFARFKALIDEELARAKASGVPRGGYYAKAVVAAGEKAM